MLSPKLDQEEALAFGIRHFIDCVTNNKKPITDGTAGINVVRVLEACDASMKDHGRLITL